jgi:hypothetical protein
MRIAQKPLKARQVQKLRSVFGADAFPSLREGAMRQVIEVSFSLQDPHLAVDPKSARLRLAQEGILGKFFLNLDPGYWEGEAIPLVDREPRSEPLPIEVADAFGLEEVLSQLQPGVRSISHILETLDTQLLTMANVDSVVQAVDSLHVTMSEIRSALDEDNPKGLHQFVLRPLNDLLTRADESVASLSQRLLDETLGRAEKLLSEGSALAGGAQEVVEEMQAALGEIRPQVGRALEDLVSTSNSLEQTVAELQGQMSSVLGQVDQVVAENRPELLETLRRLRRTSWEAEMAVRKIRANPAYLLFGDEETLLDELPYDASYQRSTGRAPLYGQRDESDE